MPLRGVSAVLVALSAPWAILAGSGAAAGASILRRRAVPGRSRGSGRSRGPRRSQPARSNHGASVPESVPNDYGLSSSRLNEASTSSKRGAGRSLDEIPRSSGRLPVANFLSPANQFRTVMVASSSPRAAT